MGKWKPLLCVFHPHPYFPAANHIWRWCTEGQSGECRSPSVTRCVLLCGFNKQFRSTSIPTQRIVVYCTKAPSAGSSSDATAASKGFKRNGCFSVICELAYQAFLFSSFFHFLFCRFPYARCFFSLAQVRQFATILLGDGWGGLGWNCGGVGVFGAGVGGRVRKG